MGNLHGTEINLILNRLTIEFHKLITNKVELELRSFIMAADECGRKKIISFIRRIVSYEGNNKSTQVKLH